MEKLLSKLCEVGILKQPLFRAKTLKASDMVILRLLQTQKHAVNATWFSFLDH